MRRFPLFLVSLVLAGCANNDAKSHNESPADSTEAHRTEAGPRDLIGRWALVDQQGYGINHPLDVNQVLTFDAAGRMTNLQSTGGQSLAMVLSYRVVGDQILASVESAEMNGEPFDLGERTPQQTYKWRIESGRLILSGSEPGTFDVYHREYQ